MTNGSAAKPLADGAEWSGPPAWSLAEAVALVLASLLGFALRWHDYASAPAVSDNHDELAWAWSGLTLITRHVPYGWSYLPSYTGVANTVVNGATYPIVHPWFDHPPLFGLLVGGYAWLMGAREFSDISPAMIRPLAVVLSTASILLAYLLLRRLLPVMPAMLSVLLLATAPFPVLLGREVESEALLTPMLLLALLMVHRLMTGDRRRRVVAVLVAACLVAALTKVPGFAVCVIAGAVLLTGARWRPAVLAVAGGVAGFMLYVAYGAIIDWHQFTLVLHDQEIRRHGVMAAYEFLASASGIGHGARDGWWVLGLVGVGALMVGREAPPRRLVVWGVLIYSLAMLVLADERVIPRYGWYRIPVYPLVYCGAAYLAWLAFEKLNIAAWLAVLILGGASATTAALNDGDTWMPSALLVVALLAAALSPLVAAWGRPQVSWLRPAARVTVATGVVLMVLFNVMASVNLASTYRLL